MFITLDIIGIGICCTVIIRNIINKKKTLEAVKRSFLVKKYIDKQKFKGKKKPNVYRVGHLSCSTLTDFRTTVTLPPYI